ncbi:hypothetical protein N656DRAFT_840631 [Canariomyces notabilis]|uniref:FluG domain-containing protein n=1 Tax=Canariomyces notabilis TaxID=2074819 RepID=A0AAN6QBD3_9PEZI|nr:hypothetical protein N656DRAFT_840631 [Canariomyces arenarius]
MSCMPDRCSVSGNALELAVLAAEFGRAGPPFSGVSTCSHTYIRWRRPRFPSFPHRRPLSLESAVLPSTLNAIAMPARRPPQPLTEDRHYNAHFVQRFTQQEAGKRIAKRPAAYTAEQRAALRKQLEDTKFLIPDYADKTKINIAGLLRKWKRYCEFAKLSGTWREVMQKANRAMAMDFLEYLCQTCRIVSWSASWQYFRQYKQLYASVTGRYMDTNDSKEVKKWHDTVLVPRYRLQAPCTRGKDVANADTLLVMQTFNIKYDTGIFSWERHRIQLLGCYLGLAFTGARPAEFVDGERKSGKDGSLEELFPGQATGSVPSDEDKAPDEHSRLLEEIMLQEYKRRGRPKALCYEDIQLMVVRHPETGEDALAMAIRLAHHKGADNKPKPTIFFFTPTRRLIFCFITVIVSLAVHDRAFAASKFTSVREVFQYKNRGPVKCTPIRWKEEWLKRPIFRRLGDSEYQPLPYQKLLDDMTRQSLDAGEERAIEPKAWRRGAANAANGSQSRIKGAENEDRIRELTRLIASKEAQRKKNIRRAYREDYFYNRPTWDIEADEGEEEYTEPAVDLQIPERAKLAEILCNQPDNLSSAELLELRIQAAELMVSLCDKRETRKRDCVRQRARTDVVVKEESPGLDSFPLLMDKKQCPLCIGDETLSYEERTFKYCRPAVMCDHFDRKHVQQLGGVKQMSCYHPKCKQEALEFKHLNHFKNHVERVHGIRLRA